MVAQSSSQPKVSDTPPYRDHVHVIRAEGEAKFWLEPEIELARNYGLSRRQLKEAEEIVEEHQNEFRAAWHQHFGS